MNITYKLFDIKYLDAVTELQNEWVYEDITFGVVNDNSEKILNYQNDYFYIALDDEKVIGYITADVVNNNEYNIFPKGACYLQINDLYIRKEYRNNNVGEKLLSIVEEKANANGLQHIFISSAAKDSDAVKKFYTKNGYDIWTTVFYKRKTWDVRIYTLNELIYYKFVVIFARYKNKWVYSRHRLRDTYETAGGHIEKGETSIDAAKRELYEETGAIKFEIHPLFDYSVHTPKDFANGQVYFAEITEIGELPESEMSEIKLFETIPNEMTYPQILPVLFEKVNELLNNK
ncbi:MAG: hypothetical protein K0S55_1457 [Clostridia bacterium]|nr:hypothetical protein [Clostridia bacterium]